MNVLSVRFLLFATLLLALTGCLNTGTEEDLNAAFTLRISPVKADIEVTESLRVQVFITRTAGFAAAVEVDLVAASPGFEAEGIQVSGSKGELVLVVTEEALLGVAFLTVRAEAEGIVRAESLTLRVTEALPEVTSVTRIGDDPSLQVRQGAGTITLLVAGTNLDRPSKIRIEDLETTIINASKESVTLAVMVEHGVSKGTKALLLTSEAGAESSYASIEVTEITVSPSGDDLAGVGTQVAPYLTLGRALAESAAGDTVLLLPGEYTNFGAGSFDPNAPRITVPAGVWVRGVATDTVSISGAGANHAAGIALVEGGVLSDLTLHDFDVAVTVDSGDVALIGVDLMNNRTGLQATGGMITVEEGRLWDNGSGVRADGQAVVSIISTEVRRSEQYGLEVSGEAVVRTNGLVLSMSGAAGVAVSESATVYLTGGQITFGQRHGLLVSGGGTAVLDGARVTMNMQNGIEFQGRSLELRNVIVDQNSGSGLHLNGAPERVDLGSISDEGGNKFRANGLPHISDERPERASLEPPPLAFTISGSTFDGVALESRVYVGPFTAPALRIWHANNAVQVLD